jgi:excinuclease UvrABC nuclease subunit
VIQRRLAFSPDRDEAFFAALPATPAVFLLRGDGEPYVSKTANFRRRLQRLLGKPTEQSKRLNLRDRVREIEFTATGSDFESQFLLYKVLRASFPKAYSDRLRFRFAPLVKLHLENEYPRASVTTRLGKMRFIKPAPNGATETVPFHEHTNLYYGPFPSRTAAEKFASDALDFFKMRRCVDDLHPDPAFPGCVYSEMKMCLAPCFKGCTDSEYHTEVARVQAFFDSGGESLSRELAEHRDNAATELAFEDAAAVHTKIEKLKPLISQLPEIIRRVDGLAAIIVQPSAEPHSVSLFYFSECNLRGPLHFSIEPLAESRSMESRIEEAIQSFTASGSASAIEHMEHLAILKRWFYRTHRAGEIFFADEKGSWPLRRIVRGIGRVFHGEKSPEPAGLLNPIQ